jgi:hypothetical protein
MSFFSAFSGFELGSDSIAADRALDDRTEQISPQLAGARHSGEVQVHRRKIDHHCGQSDSGDEAAAALLRSMISPSLFLLNNTRVGADGGIRICPRPSTGLSTIGPTGGPPTKRQRRASRREAMPLGSSRGPLVGHVSGVAFELTGSGDTSAPLAGWISYVASFLGRCRGGPASSDPPTHCENASEARS